MSDPITVGIREAADKIGVSPDKVRQLIATKKLPAKKLDSRVLVAVADLEKFIDELPAA